MSQKDAGGGQDDKSIPDEVKQIEKLAPSASDTTTTKLADPRHSFGSFISKMFGSASKNQKSTLKLEALERLYNNAVQFVEIMNNEEENSNYRLIGLIPTLELVRNALPQDIEEFKVYDPKNMAQQAEKIANDFSKKLETTYDIKQQAFEDIIESFITLLPLYEKLSILVKNYPDDKNLELRSKVIEELNDDTMHIKNSTIEPIKQLLSDTNEHLKNCYEYVEELKNAKSDQTSITNTQQTITQLLVIKSVIEPITKLDENLGKINDAVVDYIAIKPKHSND